MMDDIMEEYVIHKRFLTNVWRIFIHGLRNLLTSMAYNPEGGEPIHTTTLDFLKWNTVIKAVENNPHS